jgi:hypothetical protein
MGAVRQTRDRNEHLGPTTLQAQATKQSRGVEQRCRGWRVGRTKQRRGAEGELNLRTNCWPLIRIFLPYGCRRNTPSDSSGVAHCSG